MTTANSSRPHALAIEDLKIAPGAVLATPGALSAISKASNGRDDIADSRLAEILRRHLSGDWGEVPAEDWHLNDQSLETGDRILSAYTVGMVRVWIITDAGHTEGESRTTILLPEEY